MIFHPPWMMVAVRVEVVVGKARLARLANLAAVVAHHHHQDQVDNTAVAITLVVDHHHHIITAIPMEATHQAMQDQEGPINHLLEAWQATPSMYILHRSTPHTTPAIPIVPPAIRTATVWRAVSQMDKVPRLFGLVVAPVQRCVRVIAICQVCHQVLRQLQMNQVKLQLKFQYW